ncbi:MAG: hypothetical protein B7Z16_16410 [Algoriphagus sp. 32-45-6]|nr:MAG: hypothetical protein B7Z16_16410 [Algoriphagus sp. 32-45-6]
MRLFLLLFFATQLTAQTLEVSGEVEKPLKLALADLELLPHQTVDAVEHSGEKAQYSGVPIYQILKSAGVPMGEQLRGPALSLYIVVIASDGYQAVYALPRSLGASGHQDRGSAGCQALKQTAPPPAGDDAVFNLTQCHLTPAGSPSVSAGNDLPSIQTYFFHAPS